MRHRWLLAFAGLCGLIFLAGAVTYTHFSHIIDSRLQSGAYQGSSQLFASPRLVAVGDPISEADLITELQRNGYNETAQSRAGTYQRTGGGLRVRTGTDAYTQPADVLILFGDRGIKQIVDQKNHQNTAQAEFDPELISNVFGSDRGKRRLVQFRDLPPQLIQAVTSVEDKHFFEHSGFDLGRIAKAAYVDVKQHRKEQGASTLSMQLARNFFLDQHKTWQRKFNEAMITAVMEWKLSKQQIFEYYANEVYLGQSGSFAIHGFAQAAQSYFNKSLRDLSLPQLALLAGTIQRPAYFNPFRYPERAKSRRNIVLLLMRDNGYINEPQYQRAANEPVTVHRGTDSSTDAPYFVDLVNERLDDLLNDRDLANNSYRIYTTLDSNLQREAEQAVRIGMLEVDKQIQQRGIAKDGARPQVAMVVLDPQTGAVKALIGGRNYSTSQLNHALSKRQPGSIFKPFVYAAAFQSAIDGKRPALTTATALPDYQMTFRFGNQTYQPGNFHDQYYGSVTARTALTKSLNVPTVRMAELAGYDRVVQLAKAAGMNENIQPTPSVALGSYEVTPLEIAGAYTMLTRKGRVVEESWVRSIRSRDGREVYAAREDDRAVLDPRAAFLVVDIMQDVIRQGTAAAVRGRGFTLPAAGKTGTSHDGWFAGFTSKLLCIVWVGFDDNRELDLEGSKSALPIWTEFMKRAHQYAAYRDAKPFPQPDGLKRVNICTETGQLPTEFCPLTRADFFLAGTQPTTECTKHDGLVHPEDEFPEEPSAR